MSETVVRSKNSSTHIAPVAALYLAELCGLAAVLSLYRFASKPTLFAFLTSPSGLACVGSILGLLLATVVLVRQFSDGRFSGLRQASLTITMNLIVVLTLFGLGEVTIRLSSSNTPQGVFLGDMLLRPREWQAVVDRNRDILKRSESQQPYFVSDDLLGWTIGPNRRSANGLYLSSVEGIRSPAIGMTFAGHATRYRIALVGDSFTFGEEVKFEESWGHQLELLLGPEFQVLNFGVGGYGIDQMYLRYKRDVYPWRPDIVILGFIGHDLIRSLMIYPFIGYPDWEMPWAKPRFTLEDNQLKLLNVPTPPVERIFSAQSIRELPLVEYDWYYSPTEWDRRYWRYLNSSFLFRTLVSLHPPWESPGAHMPYEELYPVNGRLLRSFVEVVRKAGSIPIVVYLPVPLDLRPSITPPGSSTATGLHVLRVYGIEHVDLTPCLRGVKEGNRFTQGEVGHYSPQANKVVAECLGQVVLSNFLTTQRMSSDH